MTSLRNPRGPNEITFFGHFGSSNPGNESTLVTILSELRSRYPGCTFRCICTNPEAVIARDGIEAIPMKTRVAEIWNHGAPLPRRVPLAIVGVGAELGQYARAWRALRSTDMLIVPGTGLVTDVFGITGWGPYSQFKWVLMAKLARCQVLFISIGAGPIATRSGAALIRATMWLADYRSYRDEASRQCLRQIGVPADRDPVYPDLVFSLPDGMAPGPTAPAQGSRRVVGLGLMVYYGKYSTEDPDPGTYGAYLESLAAFAAWLLEHDYDIRLLLGDGDRTVIGDFLAALRARTGGYDQARIVQRPIASIPDVLDEIAATDLVVATRFHNVLMAMLLGKPVMAISFHHKCSALMQTMNLSEYCHDIHRMDADRLIRQFEQLQRNGDDVERTIARGVQAARAALEEQYERVFTRPGRRLGRGSVRPAERSRRLTRAFLRVNERAWRRLPVGRRDGRVVRRYGAWLHELVCRNADRQMYLGTLFMRNRPALELMRRLVATREHGERVTIAVLGCSIGVEVYSILWILRRSRPDLEIEVHALDISAEVVDVAQRGVYGPASCAMVSASVFETLTEDERREMFDWAGDTATIKPWLRDGITWEVADAADPALIDRLGPRDLIVASNFLCHLPAPDARRCLRNLARLVAPGGHLFVSGVDLDVRAQIALEQGWEPLADLRQEIHDGDPLVRADWPWQWFGLEPLDRRRPDGDVRYSAAFRIGTRHAGSPGGATTVPALGPVTSAPAVTRR